jgi:hypothetical protein
MMDRIYQHLHRSMAQPFQWGQSDCMMDVANYLELLTGFDCGKRFRGMYSDAASCQRVSGFLKDPIKPFADCMGEFPLKETQTPKRGDVGVVTIIHDRRETACGGIFLGKNWAMKIYSGLSIGEVLGVLKAWEAPNEK